MYARTHTLPCLYPSPTKPFILCATSHALSVSADCICTMPYLRAISLSLSWYPGSGWMMPILVITGSISTAATSLSARAASRAAKSLNSTTFLVVAGGTGGPMLPARAVTRPSGLRCRGVGGLERGGTGQGVGGVEVAEGTGGLMLPPRAVMRPSGLRWERGGRRCNGVSGGQYGVELCEGGWGGVLGFIRGAFRDHLCRLRPTARQPQRSV